LYKKTTFQWSLSTINFAEREGFEPSIPFIEVYSLSRLFLDWFLNPASVSVVAFNPLFYKQKTPLLGGAVE